jgi:protein-S-isoprenylcysteine O-methyltransferase Ste14
MWNMQLNPEPESTAKKVISNILEGNIGQRGEIYVLLQFLLISQVVNPIVLARAPVELNPILDSVLYVGGLVPLSLGMALAAHGSKSLGENLTPWPKPIAENQLMKDGAFSLCRHPIYGGLLLACMGLSLTTVSPGRILFTVVLFALLYRKAQRYFLIFYIPLMCAKGFTGGQEI